jgi:hypothetical protein
LRIREPGQPGRGSAPPPSSGRMRAPISASGHERTHASQQLEMSSAPAPDQVGAGFRRNMRPPAPAAPASLVADRHEAGARAVFPLVVSIVRAAICMIAPAASSSLCANSLAAIRITVITRVLYADRWRALLIAFALSSAGSPHHRASRGPDLPLRGGGNRCAQTLPISFDSTRVSWP